MCTCENLEESDGEGGARQDDVQSEQPVLAAAQVDVDERLGVPTTDMEIIRS